MARSKYNKTYVYDEKTKELVPVYYERERVAHDIMPDLPDFVSTVDGSVIHGRAGLREHNRRHNVTNPADFKGTWEKFQKKREALMTGTDRDPKRLQAVVRAFNDLQERNRNRRSG